MDQTIEDGKKFIAEGTYDVPAPEKESVLGKRKVNPVKRFDNSPTRRPVSRSKSPARKKRRTAGPVAANLPKQRTGRSLSPKKKPTRVTKKPPTSNIRVADPATVNPVNKALLCLPVEWKFNSKKPAFGVHVSQGKCWMSNDDGDLYAFSLDGKMERHIKLPSGIKSVVSDMGMWLYAGCDDGVVYDLSNDAEPREAYRFQDMNEEQIMEAFDKDPTSVETQVVSRKPRHIVFVIDRSSSMRGDRIAEVVKNLQMIYEYHLRDGDYVSLITFATIPDKVKFSRIEVGKNDAGFTQFIYNPILRTCSGATAFFDALGEAWKELTNRPDEEQWIIALTDGQDNRSRTHSKQSISKLAKETPNTNLICVFASHSLDSYASSLQEICENTENGLFIHANTNTKSTRGGITNAFKQIAQLLSSKVMWMDIRDGLLSVSDNIGRIVACSIEGNPIWQEKSEGTCGWMVRSDFEGVYHGHSKGVSTYSPVDGKKLWHVDVNDRVLYGWKDKNTKMLFVAAGSFVHQISCADGTKVRSFSCDSLVISTAASFGADRIFCADDLGNVYCFSPEGKREWKLATNNGVALSMHFSDEKLFLVTDTGFLLCISLEKERINEALKSITGLKPKAAVVPKDIQVVLPDSEVEETTEVGDGIIVEIYREFTDEDLLTISNHIHNPETTTFSLKEKEYAVENHKNGCRCVRINGVVYIEQNKEKDSKYAKMAKNGDKVTWLCTKGKWGLIVNDTVEYNASPLLARVAENDKGFDRKKLVQFPKNLRKDQQKFVVEQLLPSKSNDFYRVQGKIKRLIEQDTSNK